MQPDELAQHLGPTLGDRLLGVEPYPGMAGKVRFESTGLLPLLTRLRDDLGFTHLSMVAGIDWVDRREVLYVLWADRHRQYVLLSTDVPADSASIESATPLFPTANWHEREAWEMVDIHFEHHPDLRHLLMPDGYAFHPLLRSFKLHEPEELEVKTRNV